MLKAYKVYFENEEWCTLVHGETRGSAKARFFRINPMAPTSGWLEFTEIRLARVPGLDDKIINYDNAKAAGFEYIDTEEGTDENGDEVKCKPAEFTNDCDCEICRGAV